MKLYECPRGSIVRPKLDIGFEDDHFIFDHIDGMYSYCKTMHGEVFHPVAWLEVDIIGKVENGKK